jgi:RNA polymerase sigma factor (sigma-70 family)
MAQEPGTVEDLFCRFGPRLRRAAAFLSRDAGEADELLQATFAAAVEAWPRFAGRSSPYTWLYSILLRLARRERERSAREPQAVDSFELPAAGADPAAGAVLKEETQALRQCLQELPQDHREVLVLFYLESMRYRDIAEAVGVPIGTVKSRLYAAKQELARRLQERGIEL